MIPSMGGTEIGDFLRTEAARVKPDQCIVELGVFLGAGTVQLSQGADQQVPIFCYDRFEARNHEIEIAAKFGVGLTFGEDTLPRVQKTVSDDRVFLHKGLIQDIKEFCGPKIGLFVDDVCKRKELFLHAMDLFSPWWIPGETVVLLMDFWYFTKKPNDPALKFQHDFMLEHAECFEPIQKRFFGLSCAAFRYLGGLDSHRNRVSKKRTICEVLREINDLHQTGSEDDEKVRELLREAQDMGKRMSRKLLHYNKEVFKDWWEENQDYEADLRRRMDENYIE
jgi:hypothetical protein